MALSTFVKVTNITNLSDARYCAGMGVHQLGFNLVAGHDDFVSPEVFQELTGWVSGPEMVGEYGNSSISRIKDSLKVYPIDVIAFDNLTQTESLKQLAKPLQYIRHMSTESDVAQLNGVLSYLDELVEFMVLKSGNPAIQPLLDEVVAYYSGNMKLLKGYEINVESVCNLGAFYGLQLEGFQEERPGSKDYGLIMDILEILETDE